MNKLNLFCLITVFFTADYSLATENRVFGVELGGHCNTLIDKPIITKAGTSLINFDCMDPKPLSDEFFPSVEVDATPISGKIWQVVARSILLEEKVCEEKAKALERTIVARRNAEYPCPLWGFGYKAGVMCFRIFCAPRLDERLNFSSYQIQAEYYHSGIFPQKWKDEVLKYLEGKKRTKENKALEGIDLDKF